MKKILLTAAVVAFFGGVSIAQTPETTNTNKTEIKKDQDGKKKTCSKKGKKSCCAKKSTNTAKAHGGKKSCCAKKSHTAEAKKLEKKKAVK